MVNDGNFGMISQLYLYHTFILHHFLYYIEIMQRPFMKKHALVATMAATLILVGCQKDTSASLPKSRKSQPSLAIKAQRLNKSAMCLAMTQVSL